jgi:hypothetical protein
VRPPVSAASTRSLCGLASVASSFLRCTCSSARLMPRSRASCETSSGFRRSPCSARASRCAHTARTSRPCRAHSTVRPHQAKAGLVTAHLELSGDGKALKYYEATPFSLHLTPDVVAAAATTLSNAGDGDAVPKGKN